MALFLIRWLPKVLPSVKPWMSTEDIQKGKFWTSELRKTLKSHRTGVFCVTPENYMAPWLIFEAGALSNTSGTSKVIPLLLGMAPEELNASPLTLFQTSTFDRQEILRLLRSINTECDQSVDIDLLRENFEIHWPDFLNVMQEIAKQRVLGDSATINAVVRTLAHHGIQRSVSSYLIHFDSGFETHALYSTVTEVARDRLLIFGRKNRKLFDRDHNVFFSNLKTRIGRNFDFRIMFLDPDAPRDVLYQAHRDNNLDVQIRASIKQAKKVFDRQQLNFSNHHRLYRIPRTISFIVADEIVLWSSFALDEKGRAQPLTGAPFTIVSASAPLGKDMVKNFETLWGLSSRK